MKNIFCVISAILFYANSYLFPQNADTLKLDNSLEQEILAQEDTNLEIIIKSRNLILENLSTGNFTKIKQIADYLKDKYSGSKYVPIMYVEKLLLSYCVKDYKYLLDELKILQIYKYDVRDEKVFPPEDQLGLKLGEYLSNKYVMIKGEISSSDLNEEDIEILVLNLKFLLYRYGETPFISQEEINFDSDAFLRKYPQSEYEDYIRKNIRYVIKTSDWSLGIEIGLGGSLYSGGLNDYFNSYIMFDAGLEGSYNKWFLGLNMDIGTAKAREPFEYNGSWGENLRLNHTAFKGNLGYNIFENEDFRIIPFAGVGAMKIAPTEEDKKQPGNDVSLGYSIIYSVGINTDYKFGIHNFPSMFFGTEQGTYFIRLRAGYNFPTFKSDDVRFSGGMFFFQIIWGSFGKKVYRDY
jgi:hypothetical protein